MISSTISSAGMPSSNALYEHRNKKLPLAIFIYYNYFFSFIYAVLICALTFQKRRNIDSASLNDSLLLPAYWTWVVVEALRLYLGQRGILLDRVPELAVFFLLSFFPQSFIVLYLGFLQQSILVWDHWMNVIMLAALFLEVGLTLRLLRSMSKRETTLQNKEDQNIRKCGLDPDGT